MKFDWKKAIIIVAVIALIIVLFLCIAEISVKPKEEVEENQNLAVKVDEFTGPEYKPSKVYSEDESQVKLSDLSNKPMALIFFNTTNEESLDALKIFAAQEKNYEEDVNIVAICVLDGTSENVNVVKETLANNDIKLKNVLFDMDYSAKKEYNVNRIPTFVFINKDKEIINTLEEEVNEDIVTANLDILAENYQ